MEKPDIAFEIYYTDVLRFLRGLTRDERLEEELTQETVVRKRTAEQRRILKKTACQYVFCWLDGLLSLLLIISRFLMPEPWSPCKGK